MQLSNQVTRKQNQTTWNKPHDIANRCERVTAETRDNHELKRLKTSLKDLATNQISSHGENHIFQQTINCNYPDVF